MKTQMEKAATLARTVFGEKEVNCRKKLAKALKSFSPDGLEPGREISVCSEDGTMILVYAPAETEG